MTLEERLDLAIGASEPELFGAVVNVLGFSPYLISSSYLGYQVYGEDHDDEDEATDDDETMSDEEQLNEDKVDEQEAQDSEEDESSDEEDMSEVEDEKMGDADNEEEEDTVEEEEDTVEEEKDTVEEEEDTVEEEEEDVTTPVASTIIAPAIGAPPTISVGPSVAVVAAPTSTAVSTPHHRCDECARKHKKCVRPSGRGSCQGCLRARGGPKVCSLTQG